MQTDVVGVKGISMLALLALVGLGCEFNVQAGAPNDGGSSQDDAGNNNNNNNNSNNNNSGTLYTCSASKPCPSGQFCFNGLCALGCLSNQDCAADQYCQTNGDRLCHNKVVTTCPQTACLDTQLCINGLCSTPPPSTQCDPDQVVNGNDGCNAQSICIDDSSGQPPAPKCYTFPACSEDKSCPIGTQGAVCNDGLLPNKGLICLTGLCKTAANCPSNWACFKAAQNDVLGVCSNKAYGSPCHVGADCASGTCMVISPGFPGFCQ